MVTQLMLFFSIFCATVTKTNADRILVIMPTPSYSHHVVFNPLWLSLNDLGHDVTLLTTNPIDGGNRSNFRQIDWSFSYKLWFDKHNASNIIDNFKKNLLKCLIQYTEMMNDIFMHELEHPEVKQIIANETEHFDLVIAEILNPLMIAFSKRFNCPLIGVSPMDIPNFHHEIIGNPVSPALFPDYVSNFESHMNFLERIINSFCYVGTKFYFNYYLYPRIDLIAKRYFGSDLPNLVDIQKNASVIIINVNPIIHNVRPLMKNVITLGGCTHLGSNSSLPNDVQEFLDDAKDGAIYFSFGTNVRSKDLSKETQRILLEAFSELPYKVLWKYEDSENYNFSKSSQIMVKQWLPQQEVLRHKNIRLFINQGGLQSLEESIYNAIPILAMPRFVDQFSNVKRLIKTGFGLTLDLNNLKKNEFKNIIQEIITNPRYKTVAEQLSRQLKDQPIFGIKQATWWIEYVLKYKGAKFLQTPDIPLYQYLLLDILLFSLLMLGILMTISLHCGRKIIHRKKYKQLKLE